jgi:hypothetical protein
MDISEGKTENEYLEICNDFSKRMKVKNEKITKLTKIIFVLYGLIRRGLETTEFALFEEARGFVSEFFDEEYGWESD